LSKTLVAEDFGDTVLRSLRPTFLRHAECAYQDLADAHVVPIDDCRTAQAKAAALELRDT
jgi:hypothetical protein